MELTREYFDSKLDIQKEYLDEKFSAMDKKFVDREYFDKKFSELDQKFVSKEYFDHKFSELDQKFVTKEDLKKALNEQTNTLQSYTNQGVAALINTIDDHDEKAEHRFNKLEVRFMRIESDLYRTKARLHIDDPEEQMSLKKRFYTLLDKKRQK
jgi:putative protein kinase ArgK-like GTPase of G3E family